MASYDIEVRDTPDTDGDSVTVTVREVAEDQHWTLVGEATASWDGRALGVVVAELIEQLL